ncbi:MAG: D-aminoacyl-tRNA deacylase [Eubacteriales bacterium]|nr:D-aminoacyl-tRNA deacylase [Eubacteriales bacterium]
MRAVVQRVSSASVTVQGAVSGAIGQGLVVLLGVEEGDTDDDVQYICQKVAGLRIFEDDQGKMNRDVGQIGGAVLLVSQFTLCGDARKGRRPSFAAAARPAQADALYQKGAALLKQMGVPVQTGQFQAHMMVSLVNDGPVTILLDSKKLF